jgi:ABC-type uncharacterized transport system permease subunit
MTVSVLLGITHACFGLSYLLAFGCELAYLRWPRPGLRVAGLLLGLAGLLAHTAYLAVHRPTPAAPYGSLLLLAWVLAVFYWYGTVHHPREAWAVFVLPVVLGLVALSLVFKDTAGPDFPRWLTGEHFWGTVHGVLLLLAAVGLSVGALASVMYLVQARRLRQKRNPLGGMHLLSLERLEAMNRRAVNAAFPMLLVGVILGMFLLHPDPAAWLTPSVKVLGSYGLVAVVGLLLYLRYAVHVPGRRLARLTILAFVLMVAVLAAAHPFAEGAQ